MSFTPPSNNEPAHLGFTQWLIVIMAAIGFAFDIYELLMLPLVLGRRFWSSADCIRRTLGLPNTSGCGAG